MSFSQNLSFWSLAVSRGASEPAEVAGVVAAEPAGVAVGP